MDDSTVLSRNNEDISSDYDNIINEYKDTSNNNITIMIINDTTTHVEINNTYTINIRSQQYLLPKPFLDYRYHSLKKWK